MLWWMIAKLKSDNPATRLQAVAELSGTEGPRAADALAQALKDKDWELQAAAVRALINRNDPRAQTHLVQMLATRWSAQAADLLVTIGEQAIAPLVGTLTSLNGQSWEALKVLKRLGWKAQSLVHRAMCAVVDGKYSEAAACGPVSLDPLLAALKQKHIAVDEIVRALGELGDVRAISPIVEALGSEFGPERSAALEALKKIGPASTDALAEALKHENPRVREGAALALGEMGDVRRVEALLAALADPNHAVRAAAVFALGEIKDPAAVDPLINALSQSNDHLREHIFHALGRTRDARVAAALTTILQEKSLSHRLQEKGLEALREIPGGESLAEALISNNEQLQAWSVRAATQLSDPQALELLAEGLRHPESAVREKAAQILGELPQERAVEPLISAILDPEESVARAAARALARINSRRAVEPLMQALQGRNNGGRRWSAFALGELRDSRAAEPLIHALHDQDAGVRTQAARALATAGGRIAVDALGAALGDSERSVREAATYALAAIDDPRSTDMVWAALGHDDLNTRTAATRAWKKKANPNGIAALLINLQKGDSDLSYAAVEALEAILEGSAGAAQLEDLRAIERLGDVFPIEARDQADRRDQQRLEINCRPLKRLAYAELLRRGAAAVAKTV